MTQQTERIGGFIIALLIIIFIGLGANTFISRSSLQTITPSPTPNDSISNKPTNSQLQLQTFTIAPNTPTPFAIACNHDNGQSNNPSCTCQEYLIECQNNRCVNLYKSGMIPNPPSSGCKGDKQILFDRWCSISLLAPKDGTYCIGKPVIYLYPSKTMQVSVKLDIPGIITKSIPSYPFNTGWQHIEAHPDGTLFYNNATYSELYYEDVLSTNLRIIPQEGIVIPANILEQKLADYTTQLGLLKNEQREFLDYWLPKLYELHTPYILFSIIPQKQKDEIDHVIVSPQPDTTIAFLAYFKPLQTSTTNLSPLQISPTPPRRGFTMVEWGGTLDEN